MRSNDEKKIALAPDKLIMLTKIIELQRKKDDLVDWSLKTPFKLERKSNDIMEMLLAWKSYYQLLVIVKAVG